MKDIKIPHYTCKKKEHTGIVCLICLMDYFKNAPVYEKKPDDLTQKAENIKNFITKNSPYSFLENYDLINHALNHDYSVEHVVKKRISYDVSSYEYKKRRLCEKKGMIEFVEKNIKKKLFEFVKKTPVMIMINSNKLYHRVDAGINWIIVLDYNDKEIIIYNPRYYMEILKGRGFIRIPNTPKKRYIGVKKKLFIKCWLGLADLETRKGEKLFTPEIIKIYKNKKLRKELDDFKS